MSPLALRIRELREARRWSQAELGRRSGVPQSTVSRLESGRQGGVEFDVLERLARALGCDAGYLIVHRPVPRRHH
jgi:transcriptional regulator with XRE-family HTH domain